MKALRANTREKMCHLPHAVSPGSQLLTDARQTRVEVLYQT